MKLIDKIAWIHLVEGRILCTRSKGKSTWYLPGGKRENAESDLQTLTREIREELSVAIPEEKAEFLGVFEAQAHGHAEGICVRMTCYFAPYEGDFLPAAEIEEMSWFSHEDRSKSSEVDKIIFNELKSRGLLE